MINVVAVYWGNKFPRRYVNILRNSVAKNLDIEHKFYLYTDQPEAFRAIPTFPIPEDLQYWWTKLSIFDNPHLVGTTLYFDLDVVIKGNITSMIKYRSNIPFMGVLDKGCIARNEYGFNSSILRFNQDSYTSILDTFKLGVKDRWLFKDSTGYGCRRKGFRDFYTGDQVWLNTIINPGAHNFFPKEYIAWWREYVKTPEKFSKEPLLIFHGDGKPDQFTHIPDIEKAWKE